MSDTTYAPITVTYLGESASGKAIKVSIEDWDGDDVEHWIPWSVIEENGEKFVQGAECEIYVAEWWLREREIEY